MIDTLGPTVETPAPIQIPPLVCNAIEDEQFNLVIQKRYCAATQPDACKKIYCEECMFYKTNVKTFIEWRKHNGCG